MDVNKNYYEILGVPKNATEDEIKKAYRKQSKIHHPDVKDSNDDTAFKQINEANQILSDNQERQKYDMMSLHGANYNPNAGGFGGIPSTGDPFFDAIIRQHMGGFRRSATVQENLDIQLVINVSIEDAYNNRTIPIKYHKNVKCDSCHGSGYDKTTDSVTCTQCSGTGKDQYGITCINCGGATKVHKERCPKCKGDRIVQSEMLFNIANTYKIESDVDNMYPGQGHHSKYYNKAGSLHLHINYVVDQDYRRTNQGLLSNLDIHYQDAIDGFEYLHNHLDGKILKIKVPAGTKDKELIRLPNMGMMMDPVNREPLVFRINIVIDYDRVKKKRTKADCSKEKGVV